MKRLLLLGLLLTACHSPPELDDMGTLPPWQMTDQTGQTIGSASLRGKPWVANFLFTSCATSCPPLARATAHLQELVRAWQPATGAPLARIVSISVDPETDTPARVPVLELLIQYFCPKIEEPATPGPPCTTSKSVLVVPVGSAVEK